MSYQKISLASEDTKEAEFVATGLLESTAQVVRALDIPWEMLDKSNVFKGGNIKVVAKYDACPEKEKKAFLSNNADSILQELISLSSETKSEEILRYIMTMIEDAIVRDANVSKLILSLKEYKPVDVYSVFIGLSTKEDAYIKSKAQKIVSLLSIVGPEMDQKMRSSFLTSLYREINSADESSIQSVLSCLMSLLRNDQYRNEFYSIKNSVDNLSTLASSTTRFQIQYQVVFCFWLLTFNADIAADITTRYHILKVLSNIVGKASKEKVIRICVLTFKNILTKPNSIGAVQNARLMVTNKIVQQLRVLKEKSWKDQDLVEDLEEVSLILEDMVHDMSTWDEYCTEIRSGELSWSSVHKSEGFWRECCTKFNDNNHEMLKALIKNLDGMSPTSVSVAIHDIGEYVKHYRHGRQNIENLGAKNKIFLLMANENSDVRYEALSAIQKILVNNASSLQNNKAAVA